MKMLSKRKHCTSLYTQIKSSVFGITLKKIGSSNMVKFILVGIALMMLPLSKSRTHLSGSSVI